MILDLGCSLYKQPGHIGIDILKVPDVDVIADGCKLPFKDSSFEGVYASHTIEHIADQLAVISEMWRICKHDATIHIKVPHFSNPSYFDDLTHQRRYSTRSFEHFDHDLHKKNGHPNYLPQVNLKLYSVRLNYWPQHIIDQKSFIKAKTIQAVNTVINYLANAHHFLCERIWCRGVGGFYEVEYLIRVLKY